VGAIADGYALKIPYLEAINISGHGYPPTSYLGNPAQAYHRYDVGKTLLNHLS